MTAPEPTFSQQFDSTAFREVMGTFATGVTVVTTTHGTDVVGMTANSFTSVSLSPPLVLVSVGKNLAMHGWIEQARQFGITILGQDQVAVSNHFGGRRNPEFESELEYAWLEGIPMLSTGLANIACRLWAAYDGGDHTLYVGEVVGLRKGAGYDPLLYFHGYRALTSEGA